MIVESFYVNNVNDTYKITYYIKFIKNLNVNVPNITFFNNYINNNINLNFSENIILKDLNISNNIKIITKFNIVELNENSNLNVKTNLPNTYNFSLLNDIDGLIAINVRPKNPIPYYSYKIIDSKKFDSGLFLFNNSFDLNVNFKSNKPLKYYLDLINFTHSYPFNYIYEILLGIKLDIVYNIKEL